MARTLRIVIGARPGEGGPPVSTLDLAGAIACSAQDLGLALVSMRMSKLSRTSRYLTLRDRRGRQWIVRVSNHHQPGRCGHEKPHFDLVSLDGRAGLLETRTFLASVAQDHVAWWPPERSPKRKGQR